MSANRFDRQTWQRKVGMAGLTVSLLALGGCVTCPDGSVGNVCYAPAPAQYGGGYYAPAPAPYGGAHYAPAPYPPAPYDGGYYAPAQARPPSHYYAPDVGSRQAPQAYNTENCGTPDEPRSCPPMPRVPLQYYPADRQ